MKLFKRITRPTFLTFVACYALVIVIGLIRWTGYKVPKPDIYYRTVTVTNYVTVTLHHYKTNWIDARREAEPDKHLLLPRLYETNCVLTNVLFMTNGMANTPWVTNYTIDVSNIALANIMCATNYIRP